jgi:hypothetical protein
MEIIKFILSDFWIFIGFLIIFSAIGKFIYMLYHRMLKHISIMKHGYPPEHCKDIYENVDVD